MRKYLLSASLALFVGVTAVAATGVTTPAVASEIKYIVNNMPITTTDIQHRNAFFRLQRRKGDAANEMIEQTLRLAEAQRIGIRISDKQVNDAYARFASSNNMPLAQLDSVMAQSGVTKQHFKDFIRSQMAWNQAIGARYRAEQSGSGLTSQQEAVRNMLKKGGNKPSATEYMLQQVIFVIPPAERKSTMGKRKREAEALRARFNGCANTQQFAKGLIDVTVRDLGRVLAPQLPPEWSDQIKKTKAGGATGVRETERGVEFIGVCSAREVSDDRVAELVLQNENSDADADKLGQKYMEELKKTAKIVRR
ncbi:MULTISPECIES: peptidylprolyl isomerase [Aquamicrobium]|uniref:Peptidyl-prolyl cis-trans isomerase SurA n=1 Tax=Aquamicrobium lusatiense TaxID=89772 RepID=A0A7W9S391_9HYPH|nr:MULTISPECIES: peptidylprolyl isomerase [Aquamicrobium]MBB6013075.1 peptidyl-prolyl cis-trans isomerase SurA [Aquamicrobium lusatiense]MCK9552795.1 peptidylprolyl isomerase [Aquamicrobium sp.]